MSICFETKFISAEQKKLLNVGLRTSLYVSALFARWQLIFHYPECEYSNRGRGCRAPHCLSCLTSCPFAQVFLCNFIVMHRQYFIMFQVSIYLIDRRVKAKLCIYVHIFNFELYLYFLVFINEAVPKLLQETAHILMQLNSLEFAYYKIYNYYLYNAKVGLSCGVTERRQQLLPERRVTIVQLEFLANRLSIQTVGYMP